MFEIIEFGEFGEENMSQCKLEVWFHHPDNVIALKKVEYRDHADVLRITVPTTKNFLRFRMGLLRYLWFFSHCAATKKEGQVPVAPATDGSLGRKFADSHRQKGGTGWRSIAFGSQWESLIESNSEVVWLKETFLACDQMHFWVDGKPYKEADELVSLADELAAALADVPNLARSTAMEQGSDVAICSNQEQASHFVGDKLIPFFWLGQVLFAFVTSEMELSYRLLEDECRQLGFEIDRTKISTDELGTRAMATIKAMIKDKHGKNASEVFELGFAVATFPYTFESPEALSSLKALVETKSLRLFGAPGLTAMAALTARLPCPVTEFVERVEVLKKSLSGGKFTANVNTPDNGAPSNKSSLTERYDAFCKDATELLEQAGLLRDDQTPRIVGRSFFDACAALADLHFPEDAKYGTGPRGLIHSLDFSVADSNDRSLSATRGIAFTVRTIIARRPPLNV